ncbi:hypothetical protein BDN72DRAFT_112113 [Pluteus cervinus]|uniref:Uncharacterized protein n=1 Tax=Pluteus cervinus TaxID=181527 RepID=A0ACD3AND1_9AGAR|nr:hypothetical protein BDN72DRAFT_112113 [Pluteus cervinus]
MHSGRCSSWNRFGARLRAGQHEAAHFDPMSDLIPIMWALSRLSCHGQPILFYFRYFSCLSLALLFHASSPRVLARPVPIRPIRTGSFTSLISEARDRVT